MSAKAKSKFKSSAVVNSMTGYGKSKFVSKELLLEVEVKTVNNRFLDLNLKLPRDYSEYEIEIREVIQKYFKRGRVDLQITRQAIPKTDRQLDFKPALLKNLLAIYRSEAKKAKIESPDFMERAFLDLMSRKDILDIRESVSVNPKEKKLLLETVSKALQEVANFRADEGQRLLKDILFRVNQIREKRAAIDRITKSSVERSQESLLAKINSLNSELKLDPIRVEAEVALLVSRADVTEELVRLESHLKSFESELQVKVDGKKMEFLLQEVLREFNTIASKSNSAAITGYVVEAKTEIERIREQVQNLE